MSITVLKKVNSTQISHVQNLHIPRNMNTLVALTLMIAESRTEEKDVMVKVVVNLINKDNQ